MVKEIYKPKRIENDETGRLYALSSGSGGYHASFEEVRAVRLEDGTYEIKLTTPGGVKVLEENIDTARKAVERARTLAEKKISKGMPGTGRIEAPDFDLDQVPEDK